MKSIPFRTMVILGGVSAFSVVGYLLVSLNTYGIGFPLDDAWIHQTYARNFGLFGEWTFIPGEPSGGSTSPLWGLLISIGHLLGLHPFWWTFFLGWLSLWGISVIGFLFLLRLGIDQEKYAIYLGILLSLEWHLIWSACSGMETLLFAFIIFIVFYCLFNSKDYRLYWLLIGGLVGVSVWLRPDGLTLLGPAIVILIAQSERKRLLKFVVSLVIGFVMISGAYLWFNTIVADSIWPNTFFAKQAEYLEVKTLSIFTRFIRQFNQPLIGVGVCLLPGHFLLLRHSIQKRRWDFLALIVWIGGYLFLYAWRLPVTYQHGRYVMPVIPVFTLLGFYGFLLWISNDMNRVQRVLRKTWVGVIIFVVIFFWGLGARSYASDVGVIETEMVTVAHWLRKNTNQNDLIAAHDIGAIGYFSNRRMLDLAGLISPDVIPFIRDEKKLAQYLDSEGAEYLVTFPSWYPHLINNGVLVYETGSSISPALGGENMMVYRWSNP
jgi:hypothetical protein